MMRSVSCSFFLIAAVPPFAQPRHREVESPLSATPSRTLSAREKAAMPSGLKLDGESNGPRFRSEDRRNYRKSIRGRGDIDLGQISAGGLTASAEGCAYAGCTQGAALQTAKPSAGCHANGFAWAPNRTRRKAPTVPDAPVRFGPENHKSVAFELKRHFCGYVFYLTHLPGHGCTGASAYK